MRIKFTINLHVLDEFLFHQVEMFDGEKWTFVAPLRARRCRLAAETLGGRIYVAGGYDGSQFVRISLCVLMFVAFLA